MARSSTSDSKTETKHDLKSDAKSAARDSAKDTAKEAAADPAKKKALELAVQQIERAFGKGSIMKLGSSEQAVETEVVSTGSLGLDIALGIGGLPRGRIVEVYGPESSGKTTLALQVCAEAQKAATHEKELSEKLTQMEAQLKQLGDDLAKEKARREQMQAQMSKGKK